MGRGWWLVKGSQGLVKEELRSGGWLVFLLGFVEGLRVSEVFHVVGLAHSFWSVMTYGDE